MKVPFSWLKQYVDIDVSAQELETKLFDCGFEVEELIDLGAEISKVVVGVVTECVPQEGTHLHICKVDCGDYGHDIQISTGAANVYAGMHTPAALDGSTLPGGIKIKAKPLMGIESNGMLCSGEELGLNEDLYPGAEVYGLLDLPKDTVPGTPIQQVVGLDDYIFDISITANRADCQSVLGIAREVAAVLNKPLKMPATDYTVSDYKDPRLSITVEAPDLCPRYLGHYVRNITTGESPRWMRRQLALCGLRSISNVVDITNYVMLEIGQPMHAFDMDTLESCQIIVRRAKDGEEITTLDEKNFKLTPNNLVICDGSKPVALAGVMGGLNSEIKPETTQLLFESAKFARDNIRKTARGLGQNTDASSHYEKGISEYTTELGMARALHLIQELGCGEVTAAHFDCSAGAPREGKHFTATISGMAAFFSALFGTPLAAACFAMMVEDVGLTFTSAFVPAFTSALIAYGCSLVFGIAPTHFALTAPELNVRTALLVILLGVACAAVSRLFCYTLHFMEHTVPKLLPNPWCGSLRAACWSSAFPISSAWGAITARA